MPEGTIVIERGRPKTKERKYRLSSETVVKMDHLLEGVALNEKSKAIDVMFSEVLDKYMCFLENGNFHVAYPASGMEIIK